MLLSEALYSTIISLRLVKYTFTSALLWLVVPDFYLSSKALRSIKEIIWTSSQNRCQSWRQNLTQMHCSFFVLNAMPVLRTAFFCATSVPLKQTTREGWLLHVQQDPFCLTARWGANLAKCLEILKLVGKFPDRHHMQYWRFWDISPKLCLTLSFPREK